MTLNQYCHSCARKDSDYCRDCKKEWENTNCYKCGSKLPEPFNYLMVTLVSENNNDRLSTICSDLCHNCIEELKTWLKSDGNKGYRV